MKLILLISSIFFIGAYTPKERPIDFEYQLSEIAREFKSKIMDKNECGKLKLEASYLTDDIENAIQNEGKYSPDEIIKLKEQKKESEALENFIAVVGNCGNYVPSINDFNLANRRVGADVSILIKSKDCVDIISVSIGDYVAYLGKNNSTKNYIVTYKWKEAGGMKTGNGTMGLSNSSVRYIYDNREVRSNKNISFFGITCRKL